jgi:uncharacterized protein YndB with AHSA1/START domain
MMDIPTIESHGRLSDPTTLTMQRLLPGPVSRVWAWLTESELRAKWLAAGEMPMSPGADFTLTWRNDTLTDPPGARPEGMSEVHAGQCRVLEADPPRRLRFEWSGVGEVTFDLQPAGERVLLTLTHRRLAGRGMILSVSAGWHAHLDVMEAKLSGKAPRPHWDNWRALREVYAARFPE